MTTIEPSPSAVSHDRIFKEFLHRFLPEFIQLFFPDEAKRLNFATLSFLDKELLFNLPGPKVRITDVIAEVNTNDGEPEIIIVHVEVEARQKKNLPQRMFEYYSLVRLLREKPALPLALVLIPRAGGLRWQTYKEELFGRELLHFRYGQVGLRDLPVEEYLHQDEPVASALAVLMKLSKKRPSSEALANLKIKSLHNIANSTLTEGEQLFLMSLVETYIPQSKLPVHLRGIVMEALPDVELMWHEQIERDAERRGVQQGQREMLLRLLAKKFGSLPQDWIDYIEEADDPSILEAISDQLFTADSLDQIILPHQ